MGQEAYKNYDIGSYRLPDITRNELDFSVNSEGKFSDMSESDVVSGSIMGNFDVTFNRYRNARTFRGTQQASVALSGQYAKDQQEAKTRNYDVGLYYTNSSRFYGDDYEGLFFETGGKASFLAEGIKNFGDGAEQPRNHTSKVLELSLAGGQGPYRAGGGRPAGDLYPREPVEAEGVEPRADGGGDRRVRPCDLDREEQAFL
mgnify:CR=1 FL=1